MSNKYNLVEINGWPNKINLIPVFSLIVILLQISPKMGMGIQNITETRLRVIANEYPVSVMIERDANQNMIRMEGVSVEMLQWMAHFDHFSYSVLPIFAPAIENTSKELGAIYYAHKGQADLIISSVIMTPERFRYLDFPHPWMEEAAVLVIPAPDSSTNISSIWKPFQLTVWILIIVSIILIIAVLYFIISPTVSSISGVKHVDKYYATNRLNKLWLYVLGLLLSQGGLFKSNHFSSLLVVGTWCLATFVLVQAYSSTLISFVTTPISTPLIKSLEELASKTNVYPVVRVNYAADVILTNSQDPLLKQLGDKIKAHPNSRCPLIEECMEKVVLGHHVLIHGYGAVLESMNNDFKKSGRCRFSLAKETFYSRFYSWALAKHSPKTEAFNRGILQMREKGLVTKWQDRFQAKPRQCLDKLEHHRKQPTNRPKQLSIESFIGAFLLLCIGYCLSTVVFICEKISV